MKRFEIFISMLMLLFAIGFNLWLYRAEPTAAVDPNDNAFQYGLVDRTNQIWDWADKTCPGGFLRLPPSVVCRLGYVIDHWVPNWAEGYNLPYYYSHVPQIMIVGSYRFLTGLTRFVINFKFQISNFKLFEYYHLIIYLLLCFFPLSVFLSLRLLNPCLPAGRSSWLTAGIGALLASHISTDGLYGMDPPSFLWRGWGLSSQLFAMIFMPLALAFSIRWITECSAVGEHFSSKKSLPGRGDYMFAILFITLTTMGHLGMGLMLFFSLPVIALTQPLLSFLNHDSIRQIWRESKDAVVKVILLALPPILILSYWIIPTLLGDAYHNVSFWDPVWKFNSYGAKEVLVNLWNGFLFDWGRLPIYTALVLVGFFVCLDRKNFLYDLSAQQQSLIIPLPFLFLFFLLLYFGKTTWGGILDFIPGMNEFHQHRFIVGLHLVGLFLAPIGFSWIIEKIVKITRFMIYAVPAGRQELRFKNKTDLKSYFLNPNSISLWTVTVTIILGLILLPPIYKQTISYGAYNETLILQANANFLKQKGDAELLVATMQTLMKDKPGRVFAGRGGGWGKDFRVAETAYFMYLSTYGIPTVLWLPETWSNNSDTEQYFAEDVPDHYSLYNIRYVVAPASQSPQPFWKLLKETASWKLYEVSQPASTRGDVESTRGGSPNLPISQSNTNYISVGVSPSIVFSDKLSFGNVIRLWIQSPYPEKGIFPELRIANNPTIKQLNNEVLPRFIMTNEATYMTPASPQTSSQGGPDGKLHSLFGEQPVYMTPWEWPEAYRHIYKSDKPASPAGGQISNFKFQISNYINILSQSSDTDMVFKATVEIKEKCPTCVVVLKQTFHPNWKVMIRKISPTPSTNPPISPSNYLSVKPTRGEPVESIDVFPSFVGVRLEEPGIYDVVFSYTPSGLKMMLLSFGTLFGIIAVIVLIRNIKRT